MCIYANAANEADLDIAIQKRYTEKARQPYLNKDDRRRFGELSAALIEKSVKGISNAPFSRRQVIEWWEENVLDACKSKKWGSARYENSLLNLLQSVDTECQSLRPSSSNICRKQGQTQSKPKGPHIRARTTRRAQTQLKMSPWIPSPLTSSNLSTGRQDNCHSFHSCPYLAVKAFIRQDNRHSGRTLSVLITSSFDFFQLDIQGHRN